MQIRRGHVLVVEDDPSIRQLLRELLESEGFEASATGAGSEACELLGRERFDAILLDVRLADMHAAEFIRTCPALLEGRLPIVLMSAAPEDLDVPRSTGVVAYIAKPFDLDDVVRALSEAVSLEQAAI